MFGLLLYVLNVSAYSQKQTVAPMNLSFLVKILSLQISFGLKFSPFVINFRC